MHCDRDHGSTAVRLNAPIANGLNRTLSIGLLSVGRDEE
jgi:hypothetical protein